MGGGGAIETTCTVTIHIVRIFINHIAFPCLMFKGFIPVQITNLVSDNEPRRIFITSQYTGISSSYERY